MKKADKILDNNPDDLKRDYHKMGRKLLWGQIDYLLKNDSKWSYYHYDSRCIERDSNGIKLRNNRSISNENLDEKLLWNKYKDPHPNSYAHKLISDKISLERMFASSVSASRP